MIGILKKRIGKWKEDYKFVAQHIVAKKISDTISFLLGSACMVLVVFSVMTTMVPRGSFINIVNGESMMPTLRHKQILFTDNIKYNYGQIITSKLPEAVEEQYPTKEGITVVKRLIGLPGDLVEIEEDGTVLVNHREVEEPYVDAGVKQNTFLPDRLHVFHLKENEYFIMGDNRGNSFDSRYFGPITSNELQYTQSISPTSHTAVVVGWVIVFLFVLAGMYELVEFITVEITYKILTMIKH